MAFLSIILFGVGLLPLERLKFFDNFDFEKSDSSIFHRASPHGDSKSVYSSKDPGEDNTRAVIG